MFLLGGVFRCVADRAIVAFMVGLAVCHMTSLVTFSVGGLGVFLMGGPVTTTMARMVTFSAGGPDVYLGAGTVQVKCMIRCDVGGAVTCFKGVPATFHVAWLVSACFFSLPPSWVGTIGVTGVCAVV